MTKESRASTAYHEAGHALAHFAFGLPFHKVTIIPNDEDGSLGAVHHPPIGEVDELEEDEKNLLIDKHILINYIAGLAEEKYTGTYNADGASHDRETAWSLASMRCGSSDEEEAYLNWLFIRSRNFVNSPVRWRQIQALANILLARQELNQDESIEIIRNAIKP